MNKTVILGNYKQGKNGEVKPIEWLVLDHKEDQVLLVSKKVLDCRPYHNTNENMTWAECDLNKWLNNEFYNIVFNQKEKDQVLLRNIHTPNNSVYGTNCGAPSMNHVFLLSIDDAEKYFAEDQEREAVATEYAKTVDYLLVEDDGLTGWWLRSSGEHNTLAAYSDYDGMLLEVGTDVDDEYLGIRPAVWVKPSVLEVSEHKATDPISTPKETVINKSEAKASNNKIVFGNYKQGNNGEVQPIEWILLDQKDDKSLLISKKILDAKPYQNVDQAIAWYNCNLNSWLNSDFLYEAFTEKERANISFTKNETPNNPKSGTDGGKVSLDRVFLLSVEEANKYFASNEERMAAGTDYAKGTELWVDRKGNSCWRLRSPGSYQAAAAFVYRNGNVDSNGDIGSDASYGVRPAIWVRSSYLGLSNLKVTQPVKTLKETVVNKPKVTQPKESLQKTVVNKPERKQGITIVNNQAVFGHYEQGDYREVKPIEWIVLDKQGNEALLVSKEILDNRPYSNKKEGTTWAECDLNRWLNKEFYEKAFNEEEKEKIILKNIETQKNPRFGTKGGKASQSYVFLLSWEEVIKYFKNSDARQAVGTDYAKNCHLWVDRKNKKSYWWLRTSGYNRSFAARVNSMGYVNMGGFYVYYTYASGVRPAIWVKV